MISAKDFASALRLDCLVASSRTEWDIRTPDLNRPGIQFCGFYEFFAFERPQLIGKAEMAYLDSMAESQTSQAGVPEWYVIHDGSAIIAGLGVIANDFHKRPDLTPNLCALFVEEPYRKRGLAKHLLNHACDELTAHGIETAYLITDHTDFYERCGWEFFTMVEEDDGGQARMYRRRTKCE